MPDLPGVHHHVLLRRRGGAAKVAWMLARLQSPSRPVSLSYELDEPGEAVDGIPTFFCPPGDLARQASAGNIVHVHGSRDWPALLEGFAQNPRPLAVTVHDCNLITGGCIFPAGCPKHEPGCPDPCPRDYPDTGRQRALKRRLVQETRPVLVSPSSWLALLLRREWPELSVSVIPNGVDVPETLMSRDEARARLGLSTAVRIVLFLAHGGEGAAYKGGGRARDLFRHIAALCPGTLGLLVGGGERVEREVELIRYPYLEGEHLDLAFRAADALVYPSLADNHPLVVLEAMAHGLPVAAFAAGGIVEQVVEGRTGSLRPLRDEEGLARAAAAILQDAALARSMGAAARERALKYFSCRRMTGDYERLYAKLSR